MGKKYLGELKQHDPLYGYLKHDIFPQLLGFKDAIRFRVFKIDSSNNPIYLYEEKETNTKVIGKFYHHAKAEIEFHNLQFLRSFGFTHFPHVIIRPLGYNPHLNHFLALDFCGGEPLGDVIEKGIHGDSSYLYTKLSALAFFFAKLHNQTARPFHEEDSRVNFHCELYYVHHLVKQLARRNLLHDGEWDHLFWLLDQWQHKPTMWSDQKVAVHGDATPANFFLGWGQDVTAIDLERMKWSDRVFDLGRITGEMQFAFLQKTGFKQGAEPFIGHFLWEYSCHFPDRETTFHHLCQRLPFYIGSNLLRIARNSWISYDLARTLIHEAKVTLG